MEIDEAAEDFEFRTAVDLVIGLVDGGDGEGLGLDADIDGVAGEGLDELLDGARDGGGEEDGLALGAGRG